MVAFLGVRCFLSRRCTSCLLGFFFTPGTARRSGSGQLSLGTYQRRVGRRRRRQRWATVAAGGAPRPPPQSSAPHTQPVAVTRQGRRRGRPERSRRRRPGQGAADGGPRPTTAHGGGGGGKTARERRPPAGRPTVSRQRGHPPLHRTDQHIYRPRGRRGSDRPQRRYGAHCCRLVIYQ